MARKPTGYMIGYARVSTEDQELRLQTDALKQAGCLNIWEEKRSATRGKRPVLDKAILDLRPGDTLCVWKLDRLARNARELYARLDAIHEAGASFKSLQENFDFGTAMGKFVLGILALVAELEAQMTAQRTSAGMQALKARGYKLGAHPKLTDAQADKLVRDFKSMGNKSAVARKYGVAPASVTNYLNRAKRHRRTRK